MFPLTFQRYSYLAVFAMTQELQPMLRAAVSEKASDVRIINVRSLIH